MKASVITLTFNRSAALQRCLESLTKQSIDVRGFELILVDASDKPVRNLVAEFRDRLNIRHFPTENRGVAANRNYGAQRADSDLLIFLDDDCVADPLLLENLLKCADEHPGFLIGGVIRNMNPDNAISCAGQVITEAVDACFNPESGKPSFLPGLNWTVPRNAYLAIGGCDENFGRLAAEDRDLIDRWLYSGGQLVKAPGAIVIHEHRMDIGGFVRQYYNYGRGAWEYHRLRRLRRDGVPGQTTQLHLGFPHYALRPLRKLPIMLQIKVIMLLGVWELANIAGFVRQALVVKRCIDCRENRR